MPAQFLLNLCIALLWVMFKDEDVFRLSTFVTGYLIGIGIVFLMYRFFGNKFYLFRVYAAIKLIILFVSELLQSSLHVMKHILRLDIRISPGIFKYETELKGDWEVTALALLLTLTPGSVVMEVTPEGNAFYIHGMDVKESKDMLLKSLKKFEKAIMEVSR
ncbi:Na+/H+ antiporter subunit E [Virgibacillus halophilus]|uniref:Na+/H+ antiporter subunit E n=1 Tax=Tigheibacillus halophilus TaxID=361280 RepID=A0ABU5C4Z0_9BACI|nr:Na+/H+ antiporter subunit E [Virgibacillus halophilus]